MSTITREQLHERAREKVKSLEFAVTQTAFADSRAELEEELELARIALASLEAEAVCVIDQSNLDYLKSGADADVWPASRKEMGDVLLYRTAPPAPSNRMRLPVRLNPAFTVRSRTSPAPSVLSPSNEPSASLLKVFTAPARSARAVRLLAMR